ncbi:MAG: HAD family hydrolase [Coxiellaceae bacterium]|nr:HAD family hydrolase [Coxiellaceae bacterium]
MKYKALLLDFDYTLVDSSRGIVLCAQYAFEQLGFKMPVDKIKQAIGHSLPNTYQLLTEDPDWNNALAYEDHFMSQQDELMTDNTVLFPEVPEFIEQAKQAGLRLAIVSTKTEKPIQELLQRERLSHHFEFVIDCEIVSQYKPHPEGTHIALDRLTIDPHQALFIGDSIFDAGAAQNAEVDFAAVLTGRTTKEAFKDFQCHYMVDHLGELVTLLDGSLLTETAQ